MKINEDWFKKLRPFIVPNKVLYFHLDQIAKLKIGQKKIPKPEYSFEEEFE